MSQSRGFGQVLSSMDWQQNQQSILTKTSNDVLRALSRSQHLQRLDLEDFKALISPAAQAHLEVIAQRSHALTRQRFGHTMQLYIPLYLSNHCANICRYCGFSMGNKLRRVTLTQAQLEAELEAIKKMGFDHILLVTGESPKRVGMDYFHQMMPIVRRYFSHVSLEIQSLDEADYRELVELGVDAVLCYQETYHRQRYQEVHLKGPKADFDYRLETHDRLGRAGVRKIGLGALLGLDEWRTDSLHVAAHLSYLERRYWQSSYTVSFPRLRPCAGGLLPKSELSDRQLVQLLGAYRLTFPNVELSISTREPQSLRDNLLPLGVTSMSAYSSTQPGGYSDATSIALEQFEISDGRRPEEVAKAIASKGYEVVWKDWDGVLSEPQV